MTIGRPRLTNNMHMHKEVETSNHAIGRGFPKLGKTLDRHWHLRADAKVALLKQIDNLELTKAHDPSAHSFEVLYIRRDHTFGLAHVLPSWLREHREN
jgi:hypothetical protein